MANETNDKKVKKEKRKKESSGLSWRNSIKSRLITAMILLTAVPILVCLWVSYMSATRKALIDTKESMAWEAKYICSNLTEMLNVNMTALQSFAGADSTISFLKSPDNSQLAEKMLTDLKGIDKLMGDDSFTAIVGTDGVQIVRSDEGECVDVSDREFFKKASEGIAYASDIIVARSSGKRVLVLIVPVSDDNNKVIGMIMRQYHLDALHKFLAENSQEAFVVDRNGDMMAHSQYEIGDDEPNRKDSVFMTSGLDEGYYELTPKGLNYKAMMYYIKEPKCQYTVVVAKRSKDVLATARLSALMIIVVGVIMLIIASFVSVLTAKSFIAPILEVNASIAKLADGSFARVRRFGDRKDEFGEMVTNTNSVIDKLTGIIASIKESAETVAVSSEHLSDTSAHISDTADTVSGAVQEISTGALQQANEIQRATENVSNIDDAVSQVQSSTETLSELSDRMKEASEASSHSLANLQKSSNTMTSRIDEISKTIAATQDAVSNINEKVESITSIATQTNLLSLNASIEAARAGEFGRGFSVVAEEIGKLANDSKEMADDIRRVMDILLEQSNAAVEVSDVVRKSNLEQQKALGEAFESVNGMLADIDETVAGVKIISQNAQTCVTSKDVVADSMTSLSAISEENAASAEQTGTSMQELSKTVSSLAQSADNLRGTAEQLHQEVEFFKL